MVVTVHGEVLGKRLFRIAEFLPDGTLRVKAGTVSMLADKMTIWSDTNLTTPLWYCALPQTIELSPGAEVVIPFDVQFLDDDVVHKGINKIAIDLIRSLGTKTMWDHLAES